MPQIEIQYRWRYYDDVRRKWFTTRYHCTEDRIQKEHPDATPVDGSRVERELIDDKLQNCTSAFLRNTQP
jgi:hypothetical protein